MYTFLSKRVGQLSFRALLSPIVALLMLSAMTPSCKKGDTGPAGTANVIFSDWFTAAPWTKDTVFDVYGFNYTQDAPAITRNVLDSGTMEFSTAESATRSPRTNTASQLSLRHHHHAQGKKRRRRRQWRCCKRQQVYCYYYYSSSSSDELIA